LRRREGPNVFDAAPRVPRIYLSVYFGPFSARLIGCHVLRIDRQRWWRVLFERVVVNGADAVARRWGDQTDNSPSATLANAELENVADRIELHTADMTALPLDDDSVDVIVSSLAIHNIPTHEGRRQALGEAMRVLRPGGRLAIADLWETRQHAAHLRERGWNNV
jgi:SAM-dependent methyltransferase